MRSSTTSGRLAMAVLAASAAIGVTTVGQSHGQQVTTEQARVSKGQPTGAKSTAPQQQRVASTLSEWLNGGGGRRKGGEWRRSGPGWTVRHVKRMAAKKRNQARNRKACR